MRAILSFVLVAAVFSSHAAPLRFLSFNIWGDYFKNPVEERQAGVESVILGHKPDLVSLQEVTPNWWASPLFANMKAAGIETARHILEPGGAEFHPEYRYVKEIKEVVATNSHLSTLNLNKFSASKP